MSHCLSFPGNIYIFFLEKSDFSALVDLEKNFSPDSIRVNFEVLKLHLCMDCHEVCFK